MKILFHTGANFSPFIKKDFDILKKHFEICRVGPVGVSKPFSLLRSIKKIIWSDLVFNWFAGPSTFWIVLFSKILMKKIVIVSGGADSAKVPEINYGAQLHFVSSIFVNVSYLLADKILAFSKNAEREIMECCPSSDVEALYVGAIDTGKFKPEGKKEELVITVGNVSWTSAKRKGLINFVKSAKYLEDKKFVLIGKYWDDSIDFLKSIAPQNIEFTDWISTEELINYMQRAKVYVQVSAHEGFGISLAEAMACECIPIVTKRGAIPEVVGKTGYYVPYNNPKATTKAVKKALNSAAGKKARERIIDRFPLEKREKGMIELIGDLK